MLTQQIIGYGWQPNHWAKNQVVLCYIFMAIWMKEFKMLGLREPLWCWKMYNV